MRDADDRRPVLVSLLDRLTDDDPDRQQELPLGERKLEQMLREAIRRDIEVFLNTRRRCVPLPAELTDARGTILDYGIPDFVGGALGSTRRRRQFLRRIVQYLREQEPRFKSVEIEMAGDPDAGSRSLQFRIEAVVYAEPMPESLSFDSRVEPVSRTFRVQV